jgi:predicted DsbA family dithiol-disulfide isomerase
VRIDRLRQNYEIEVRWVAFPLHPDTPVDGLTLEELFAGRPVDMGAMMARLKGAAESAGLPMGERKKTYNSRLAQELAKWAESNEKGDQFHEAVFRAYFVDNTNIGKLDELVKLAKATGLPAEEARSVLESRRFGDAVDQDWQRCRALGITAVPTFMINSQQVVGAQPYEVLERLVKDQGVKRRGNSG